MRKRLNLVLLVVCSLFVSSCSPRAFLTRRLAADLIEGSETFREQKQFQLHTGIVSNQEYPSPDYLPLQHRGWISATALKCPADVAPPPCWDLTLTPGGVETFQSLIAPGEAEKQIFTIPAARRELIAITGITKQGNAADVEFAWRWVPMNEVGALFYSRDTHYRSIAIFRDYDDGWRLIESARPAQPLDESLKNPEPAR